ncbi:MAG: 2-oxoacid:acceptor oxidoreductase family protein [Deltaproteobacteria bacterium]|nr:2-oxoacid:acceptor oxidoreductase family protein [Deltaproteobacteria bacterium]MBW2014416.1 2-oxoacid:acceptor oxidoreductase family protein [Deltaproteobacteria bacterium]MBW2089934.1 2-oxoacid:acceptor oxidoreductase family protein [Deltaproteobacteria bacterium]MBW2320897.1 2-oxoacid:acceptor oxidoreductase family protein [Deltaproteobacteria bacterium]
MAKEKQLTITNPSIGGSGYLTLSNIQADAAIEAGFHAAIHQCRGLAQAGGPLCVDVMIREHEVKGSVPHSVDYVNGFDLSEAWRAVYTAGDFKKSFPRGLTVVADFYVEEPILVTASRKGPRYLTRDEYLKRFEEVIDQGNDLRLVFYGFKKHKFLKILKGPFSLGVIAADLKIRKDDRFITLTKKAAIQGILNNVPQMKDPATTAKIRRLNQNVFETGYAARKEFAGSQDERIILI